MDNYFDDFDDFDFFDIFKLFIFIVIFFLLLICAVYMSYDEIYTYEYVDMDNNKGIAKECSYKFQEGRSGGQGSPVCILEDGTVLQVKQYKLVESKTCLVADKDCLDRKDVE